MSTPAEFRSTTLPEFVLVYIKYKGSVRLISEPSRMNFLREFNDTHHLCGVPVFHNSSLNNTSPKANDFKLRWSSIPDYPISSVDSAIVDFTQQFISLIFEWMLYRGLIPICEPYNPASCELLSPRQRAAGRCSFCCSRYSQNDDSEVVEFMKIVDVFLDRGESIECIRNNPEKAYQVADKLRAGLKRKRI